MNADRSYVWCVSPLVAAFFLGGLLAGLDAAHAATEMDSGDHAGNWTMAARDYANTRFSPLDQITRPTSKSLTLAWTFSTGVIRGHEAAPLVADNTMYIVTPYPNIVYALDLTPARRAGEVEVRAEARVRRRRASPAATS